MFASFVIDRPVSRREFGSHGACWLTTVAEQSRQFGFLRFSTLQEAEDFMDRNYPVLYLYGNGNNSNGDGSKVRIAFGRERKEPNRGDDADWLCGNVCPWSSCRGLRLTGQCNINNFSTRSRCFRCQALKPGAFDGMSLDLVLTMDRSSARDACKGDQRWG